ncbi:putative Rhamnan synthesis F [Microbacterium sp. C448]|uniref:rhamnan synthesis F family protein n=1 Tax=Microbacterium sp. C448 TaxID=1177594 RepID=UPI0003DE47FB|nr:rhamnan synthesis F family protein [Microbacterium sp. C448]CDJ98891.1 putative Rhamnan synthesis F [Microbacterium sp. C448]
MSANAGTGPVLSGGGRVIFFSIDDSRDDVADYVLRALSSLRGHAAHLVAIVRRGATKEARVRLSERVDHIVTSREHGLRAHHDALLRHADLVAGCHELVLLDDGWYGPMTTFDDVFRAADSRDWDAWSLTDRRDRIDGTPVDEFTKLDEDTFTTPTSSWLAFRRPVLDSPAWQGFWAEVPRLERRSGHPSPEVLALTTGLTEAGFAVQTLYPERDYPSANPGLFNSRLLIEAGCPVVSRDVFVGYPPFFDQNAVIGRAIAQSMGRAGYPTELLWRDLARTLPPKTLNANAGMLEVLPEVARGTIVPDRPVLAVVHVPTLTGLDDVLRRIPTISGRVDVVATLAEREFEAPVRESWARIHPNGAVRLETRLALRRTGPNVVSAFAECSDLIGSGRYELIVAVHTGVPQLEFRNAERYFRRHQLECLLSSPGYLANVFALFDAEPGLGLVFPPTPHIGMSTLGEGWAGARARAERIADGLNIRVPFDWASPLAPLGGMWIGRPEALLTLATHRWPPGDAESDAAHVRLLAYAAGEQGFHCRTVVTGEQGALSHVSLEYKLDFMAMPLYGYPAGAIAALHVIGPVGDGSLRDLVRLMMRVRFPRVLRVLSAPRKIARRVRHVLRSAGRRAA